MPTPKKNEKKKDFIARCIPIVLEEGTAKDQDQAVAICNSIWDKSKKEKKEFVKNEIERRYFPLGENGSEIRIVRQKDEPVKITGYFAKYNVMSRTLGWFNEIIEPNFFRSALGNSDTVDLFNHDSNFIMGRVSSGTLKIWENDIGLAYECIPPDTQLVRDMILTPIERGDVKGCSFGFILKRRGDDWDEDENGVIIRTLKADGCRELLDGSQVVFPAYPDTSIALRSMENWKEKLQDERELLDKSRIKKIINNLNNKKRQLDNKDRQNIDNEQLKINGK